MSRNHLWLLGLLGLGQTIFGAPIFVGPGAFTSPMVIDFNAIGNEVSITSQYSGSGVTFSGGIFGMTNPADLAFFPSPGPAIASDWLYSLGSHGSLPITATFTSTETLVGFLDEVNVGDTTVVTTFLGGVSHGSVSLVSAGLTAVFFGVSDSLGFDKITIDITGSSNHFIGLDDFEFQVGSTVPEPSTLALLFAGMLALALARTGKRLQRSRTWLNRRRPG